MAAREGHIIKLAEEDLAANALFMRTAKDNLKRETGSAPTEALDQHRAAIRSELRAILANPFSLRVDIAEGSRPETLYFTKARHGLIGVQPQLVSWTAPLAQLRHYAIGEATELKVPSGPRKLEIKAKGAYGRTGSRIENVEYELDGARARIADLSAYVKSGAAAQPLESPSGVGVETHRQAAVGLREIIFETDRTQDSVLRFPMRGHLLIEGAPGSGKTTVALQRIPYLIDQQYDELNLKLDSPFFSEEGTIVFVVAEVLKAYLKDLLGELRIAQVELATVRGFVRGEVRRRRLTEGFRDGGPESDQLALLKSRPELLRHLRAHCQRALAPWFAHVAWLIGVRADKLQGGAEGLAVDIRVELQNHLSRISERCRTGSMAVWAPLEGLWEEVAKWRSQLPAGREDGFKDLLEELDELIGAACSPANLLRSFVQSASLDAWATEAKSGLAADAPGFAQEVVVGEWRRAMLAKRIGVHDYTLLAWILVWLTEGQVDGRRVRGLWEPWKKYSHAVVDEGQDCTPVELGFILTLADPRFKCVTIVGDLSQRVNWPGGLDSWRVPGLMLSGEEGHIGLFRTNYRQTFELGGFAYRFHERAFGQAPRFEPSKRKRGAAPYIKLASDFETVECTARVVKRLLRERHGCSIAVLVEDADSLGRVHMPLAAALAGHGDCEASVGAELTRRDVVHVALTEQVKGLEFDCVVLVDAPLAPENSGALARTRLNKLYVGITRACDSLAIVQNEHGYDWSAV